MATDSTPETPRMTEESPFRIKPDIMKLAPEYWPRLDQPGGVKRLSVHEQYAWALGYAAALAASQEEVERLKCRHSDAWEEIAKLRASLALAHADTRRLDALERLVLADAEDGGEPAALTLMHWSKGDIAGWYLGYKDETPHATLRESLDAATPTGEQNG